jgi:hypothetical protein
MSKRHEARRRRSYGRRQHEVHERVGRMNQLLDPLEVPQAPSITATWGPAAPSRPMTGAWLATRGGN